MLRVFDILRGGRIMKKMDEMEQNIVLRSMAWGYRTAAVLLSV